MPDYYLRFFKGRWAKYTYRIVPKCESFLWDPKEICVELAIRVLVVDNTYGIRSGFEVGEHNRYGITGNRYNLSESCLLWEFPGVVKQANHQVPFD